MPKMTLKSAFQATLLAVGLLLPAKATPPMPSLNIQLKFVCLSVADDRLGAIESRVLDRLPATPLNNSLLVRTTWRSGTKVAISDISDAFGNNLHVEESIGTDKTCVGLQKDVFQLNRVGPQYESKLCITSSNESDLPTVNVKIQLTGQEQKLDDLANRIFAIASCLPSHKTNILNAGMTVGREIPRTSKGN